MNIDNLCAKEDTTFDQTSYVRFVLGVVKEEGEWKIHSFRVIYEKDCLVPTAPADIGLDFDGARESYQNLTAVLSREGQTIDNTLAGDDRPETASALVEQAWEWLRM